MAPMNARLLRPTASGAAFDPRTIAGLEAWWDGADSASVTLDGGRVAEWRDKSGNALHAANSTSGSTQPDYITAGQNGRNLLRFTAASSQRLVVASQSAFNFLHNGTLSYVATVVSFGTTANPLAFYGFFGNTNGGPSQRGTLFGYDDRSGTNDRLWCTVSNGTALIVNSNNASYNDLFAAQQKTVFEALLDTGNATAAQRLSARSNGGNAVSANTNTGTPSTDNAGQNFFIGSATNPSLFMQGDICEILFYSQHPTASAQTAIRRYLAAKWGVTLA
jgi:hypothetical protein